jgi:alkylation response protein AidB-like acyl-CoA dehydrogenase
VSIALTEEQRALADSVASFVGRHISSDRTRGQFESLARGERPAFWDQLCEQGLHLLHLPEKAGGYGVGLTELAIVVERLAQALCPGPFVPTVIASAVLAGSDQNDERVGKLLAEFADGATGALVRKGTLVARRDEDGWQVSGRSAPALGLPGADVIVVAAAVADEPGTRLWFSVRAGAGQLNVLRPVDLTRSVGTLTLRDHRLAINDVLPAVPIERVDLAVNTVLAAEAAGISRWGLQAAIDHVRTREQFGQPVGRFQAVQHKAAMLLLRTELAVAAAWDAARAEEQDAEQQRIAAAAAALSALPIAVDNLLETITLFGGVGFTWEHDAHLYQRRAISIASLVGAEDFWALRLGELALSGKRDFSFVGPEALPQLRRQVRAVLAEAALLSDQGTKPYGRRGTRNGARQALLADSGLVCPHYPPPYGLGAGPAEQAVIAQEFAAAGLEPPEIIIGEWVLPTLLEHGSDAQQRRFIMPTLRGELRWCQLFSEPDAGSDLASLRTRAVQVAGGWRLSGQKVWSSLAHQADWGICLARTDPEAPKHRGLSYFLVDMSSAGVQVRPLRQATGDAEFNEVFLDDVVVPDDCVVGRQGDGWRLAGTTLANERLSMGGSLPHGSSERVRDLLEAGKFAGSHEDAVRVLGRCTGRELALSALNLRGALARIAGASPGAEISVQKLYSAIAQRDNSRDLLRLLGPAGAAADPGVRIDDVADHLALPSVLFGGGTVEIQLNVIATRVLGLPR